MDHEFSGEIYEWRGPAPHHFVRVPEPDVAVLHEMAGEVSYGWGMIPVLVRIGGTEWETSLWPKDGGYIVPVTAKVRRDEKLGIGDRVTVAFDVRVRSGRQAGGTGPTC